MTFFERALALKGLWRKFSRDWTRRWDFGELGAFLAGLHRRQR
jgi:hypothetical protein